MLRDTEKEVKTDNPCFIWNLDYCNFFNLTSGDWFLQPVANSPS